MNIARSDSHNRSILPLISRLNGLEFLRKPRQHVTRFSRDQDMSWTDSWSTAKGDESPHRSNVFPALGDEFFGIGSPGVGVAMHEVSIAVHYVAFAEVDGEFAGGAAADGEGGVAECDTNHLDAIGVETVG